MLKTTRRTLGNHRNSSSWLNCKTLAVISIGLWILSLYVILEYVHFSYDHDHDPQDQDTYQTDTYLLQHHSHHPLDLQWIQFKSNYPQYLKQQQYCMLWCKSDDSIFLQEEEDKSSKLYIDLSPSEVERYSSLPYGDQYQTQTGELTGRKCCQFATVKDFKFLYDSRTSDMEDHAITMVTFGTLARVDALLEIRKRWHGPIVFLLYGTDYSDSVTNKSIFDDEITLTARAELEQWENMALISYIARYETDKVALRPGFNCEEREIKLADGNSTKVKAPAFPINTLRNVVMDFAKSRFVFANDIDFLPDLGSYEYFQSKKVQKFLSENDKVGLLLPHFEKRLCSQDMEGYEYPMVFEELDQQLMSAYIRPFYIELIWWKNKYPSVFAYDDAKLGKCAIGEDDKDSPVNPMHSAGVRLIDYVQWLNLSRIYTNPENVEFYPLDMNPTDDIRHFEPFFVQSRVTLDGPSMRYNELFVSRFYNKAAYVTGLRLTGWNFYSAVSHFLIHKDHPLTTWTKKDTGHGKQVHVTMGKVMDTFIATLKENKQ